MNQGKTDINRAKGLLRCEKSKEQSPELVLVTQSVTADRPFAGCGYEFWPLLLSMPSISYRKPAPSLIRDTHNTAVQDVQALQPYSSTDFQPHKPHSRTDSQALQALQDSAPATRIRSYQEAAKAAVDFIEARSSKSKQDDIWYFARAIKSVEHFTDSRLPENEYANAFWLFWGELQKRGKLPEGADFEEWLDCLRDSYLRVKYHLFENTLENAISAAPLLSVPPKYSERLERLIYVCRELQAEHGPMPFYLSHRSVGRIIESKDPYAPRRILNALIARKVIALVTKYPAETRLAWEYKLIQ